MLKGINEDVALPALAPRPRIRIGAERPSVTGKSVLVTGAGGSIGSELVLRAAAANPAELILVDNSEFNLYEINATLAGSDLPFPVHAYIADVRDFSSLYSIFSQHRVQQVFHAAALKHVSLLENDHNFVEAVMTNVRGTDNLVRICVDRGIRFNHRGA